MTEINIRRKYGPSRWYHHFQRQSIPADKHNLTAVTLALSGIEFYMLGIEKVLKRCKARTRVACADKGNNSCPA